MKITSRKQLSFFIKADWMINRGKFKPSFKDKVWCLIIPDYIMLYLEAMRKVSYYKNGGGIFSMPLLLYYYRKYHKLGIKLGFHIGYDVFGYGLKIPHYGTIIVGDKNEIGNYAVLHTSTCITGNGKIIGDGLYLSTGVKITSKINLGNNISIGANSLVNKSFEKYNLLIGGMPASIIKETEAWYIRDHYEDKVEKIEKLKKSYGL